MAESASTVSIQDIPEWKKPYWLALMNAATGMVMKPEYLQQYPGMNIMGGKGTAAPPTGGNPTTPTDQIPVDQYAGQNSITPPPSTSTNGSQLARGAAAIEEALRSNRIQYASGGTVRYAAGGSTRLADAAKAIEEALLANGAAPTGSDVWLNPGGTPFGGTYRGVNVSPTPNIPTQIGTGTQKPPTPTPPAVTPPSTAGPGGVIVTPPSGTLTPGNPNPVKPPTTGIPIPGGHPTAPPQTGSQLIPGQPSTQPATAQFLGNKPANFAGAAQAANMGYNPAQYADDEVAQNLARNMGAQVAYTNTGGPIGPPSQATLYSGGEAFQNAGLVNDAYTRFKDDPGQLQLRLSQIRDEIRSLGGTPGFKKGGVVRAAAGYMTGSNPESNSLYNPPTVNPFMSGSGDDNQPAPAANPFAGNTVTGGAAKPTNSQFGPVDTNTAYNPPTVNPFLGNRISPMTPPTMQPAVQQVFPPTAAPNPVQPQPAVQQVTAPPPAPNPTPMQPAVQQVLPPPASSGTAPVNKSIEATTTTTTGTTGLPQSLTPSFDALQDYIAFDGPRTLENGGNFGTSYQRQAVDASGKPRVDPVTGAPVMESVPQISDLSRNALSGYSAIPSAFDKYGNIEAGRDDQGNATTNYGIANDTFNSAGQLALDASRRSGDASYESPLTSTFQNTLNGIRNDPTRFMAGDISLGQLTASQLDAPMGVSPSQLTSYQMEGPRLLDMSKSSIDPTYIAGQNVDRITADSNSVRDVQGGQIGTGTFLDPGVADAYMSPYQKAVNDVRRRDAEQAYREQNATRQAAAVRAGAFGGSRQAVADSLAERDMLNQKDRITAEGQQAAFENAQAQFERDRAAKMGADTYNADSRFKGDIANQAKDQGVTLANLQSWLQSQNLGATLGQSANIANQNAYMDAATKNQAVNLQAELANQGVLQDANKTNLGAALGVQELGANQALDASKSNQAAGLRAGEANLNAAQQTQQLARTSGLTAAQANQQTRLAQNQALLDAAAREDQLQQQAAQGNVTNRLNAMGQQTNSALAANTIGQSRADLQRLAQATEFQRLQQQMGAGATVDARTQSELDMAYQDFINQRNDPYQKLNWLSGIYNSTPQVYNQEQVQFNRTNPVSQIGGLATAGLGAVSSYLNKKKGGMVRAPKVVNMKKQKAGNWSAK